MWTSVGCNFVFQDYLCHRQPSLSAGLPVPFHIIPAQLAHIVSRPPAITPVLEGLLKLKRRETNNLGRDNFYTRLTLVVAIYIYSMERRKSTTTCID